MTVQVSAGLVFAMGALVAGDYASSRALVCMGLVAMACSLLAAARALGRAREEAASRGRKT